MICNDKHSSFWLLFDRDRSDFIHTRNLQTLTTEIFKDSKDIAPNVCTNILTSMPYANVTISVASQYQSDFELIPAKLGNQSNRPSRS